jgi:DNA-binding IclR family transcriptional regulator
MQSRQTSGVNVLAKAVQVLKACQRLGGGVSLGQLAREVGIPRSTVQRIVQTLAAEGFLVSSGTARSISLGPELLAMGAASAMDIVERAHPLLKNLARETGETVDLSRLSRDHAVFVDQAAGSHRLQAVSAIGNSFPLHCTANGKAMLALMDDGELQQFMLKPRQAYTPKTITQPGALMTEIAEIRRTGLGVDNEEHTLGIAAIGMAFRAPTGQMFAISIPVPTIRFTQVRAPCERALASTVRDLGWLLAKPTRE